MRLKAFTAAIMAAAILVVVGSPAASAATTKTNPPKPHQQKVLKVNVKPGDTLTKIASKHKSTYVRLFDANTQVKDPDVIHPGEKIRIPGNKEKLPNRPIPGNVQAAVPTKKQAVTASRPQPAPAPAYHAVASGSVWDQLAMCESGGNWSINTGNGFYGGLQFTLSSWQAVGGSGYPNMASREEQIARAQILQSRQGWSAWPACSAKLGLY